MVSDRSYMGTRNTNLPLCNTQQEYSPPGEGKAVEQAPLKFE
jgi:hypothetical protein